MCNAPLRHFDEEFKQLDISSTNLKGDFLIKGANSRKDKADISRLHKEFGINFGCYL